jgi:hypothetical protein
LKPTSVLVTSLQIQISLLSPAQFFGKNGRPRNTRIKPDIEYIFLFAKRIIAAFRALGSRGNQLVSRLFKPDIGAAPGDEI